MLAFLSKRLEEGRLSAAFFAFALLLTGCTATGFHPLASIFNNHAALNKKAAEMPYASILVDLNGSQSLMVMAYLSQDNAYFISSNRVSLVLHDGYLSEIAGMPQTLLMTELSQKGKTLTAPPWQQASAGTHFYYQVLREWRDSNNSSHADRAEVDLLCDSAVHDIKLTIGTQSLQACTETLVWSNGKKTVSTLWRNVLDHKLWKVKTQPWPGAPTLIWQVARPWW